MSTLAEKIRMGRRPGTPRLVLYGTEGIGKSTFAANAPAPIFLTTEDGVDYLDVASLSIGSVDEFVDACRMIATETHDFKTVVVDSVSAMEPLVWAQVCRNENASSIEKVGGGYGKGYTIAAEEWARLLGILDRVRTEANVGLILIGHVAEKQVTPPDADPYRRYDLDLNRQAAAEIVRWADGVLFAHQPVAVKEKKVGFNQTASRGVPMGERVVGVTETPAYKAKNRWGLTGTLPLDFPAFASAMQDAIGKL